MPHYRWRGVDHTGVEQRGELFAHSLPDLTEQLKSKNIGLLEATSSLLKPTISSSQKDALYDYLATLLCAHIPLYEALSTLAQMQSDPLKKTIVAIAQQIAHGELLQEALQAHGLSDPVCSALLAVGESTGSLGPVLKQYVAHRQYAAQSRARLYRAVAGPLITVSMFVLVVTTMIAWVIPQFKRAFEAYHVPLPWITSLLFEIGERCSLPVLSYIGIGTLIVIGGAILFGRTEYGRTIYDALMRRTPIVGRWYRRVSSVRILKTLTMLLAQGVRLADALNVCAIVGPSRGYSQEMRGMKEAIEKGKELSQVWQSSFFTCPEVESCIRVGEESGKLAYMLQQAVTLQERRLDKQINTLIMVINPLLLIGTAGLIGGLAYSLYMPMITLSTTISF